MVIVLQSVIARFYRAEWFRVWGKTSNDEFGLLLVFGEGVIDLDPGSYEFGRADEGDERSE